MIPTTAKIALPPPPPARAPVRLFFFCLWAGRWLKLTGCPGLKVGPRNAKERLRRAAKPLFTFEIQIIEIRKNYSQPS